MLVGSLGGLALYNILRRYPGEFQDDGRPAYNNSILCQSVRTVTVVTPVTLQLASC